MKKSKTSSPSLKNKQSIFKTKFFILFVSIAVVAAVLYFSLQAALQKSADERAAAANPATLQTVTLKPTQDSYVSKKSPTKKSGDSSVLKFDADEGSQSYIAFNLAQIPAGSPVNSASLEVTVHNQSKAPAHNLKYFPLEVSWSESSLVYGNRPTDDAAIFIRTFAAQTDNERLKLDVTEAVRQMAGKNITFKFDTTATDGIELASNDTTRVNERPVLVVNALLGGATPGPTTQPTTHPTTQPTSNPGGTPLPSGTPVPPSSPVPPTSSSQGVWISQNEIQALPITGDPRCNATCTKAWNGLLAEANSTPPRPNLAVQDETTNVTTMAKALVYAKTHNEKYRQEVRALLGEVVGTNTGRPLAHGRKGAAYVIAADLIDLPHYDATFDQNVWRPWLREVLTKVNSTDPDSITTCHQHNSNNWGAMCGATRAAIAVYLGDKDQIADTARVLKAWTGDRTQGVKWKWTEGNNPLSWTPFSSYDQMVPVSPVGATAQGHNVDGNLPEDSSRAGAFHWPPPYTDYMWGGLAGTTVQAEILYRQGYDTWNWQSQAFKRAIAWMKYTGEGKADFTTTHESSLSSIVWLTDKRYGTDIASGIDTKGKNMWAGKVVGWTEWTHQK